MLPLDRSKNKQEAKQEKKDVKGEKEYSGVRKKVDKKKEYYRNKLKEFEKLRAQPFVVLLYIKQ